MMVKSARIFFLKAFFARQVFKKTYLIWAYFKQLVVDEVKAKIIAG